MTDDHDGGLDGGPGSPITVACTPYSAFGGRRPKSPQMVPQTGLSLANAV
jgi:hypothetical protein